MSLKQLFLDNIRLMMIGFGALQNVALGKKTIQSSPWKYASRLAVDGNKERHLIRGRSCTETRELTNPWWEVDLGGVFVIDCLRVHNRGDCCSSRLSDVLFQVSKDHVVYDFFYYRPGTVRQIEDIYPNATSVGRWVKVSISGIGIVTLCEFEVMSGALIEHSNVFFVDKFHRGTGEITQTYLVISPALCAAHCYNRVDCFSANVFKDAFSSPYLGCHLLNSFKSETTEDLNTTFIWLKTTTLE